MKTVNITQQCKCVKGTSDFLSALHVLTLLTLTYLEAGATQITHVRFGGLDSGVYIQWNVERWNGGME
jgi:hypothetical protein